MFEAVSYYPFDASSWDAWNSGGNGQRTEEHVEDHAPYLELYGETRPLTCTNLTEVLQADSTDDPRIKAEPPIFEYFWTIGIPTYVLRSSHHETEMLWPHNDAAEVTTYFPLNGGWRVEEVVASIKYVRPLPHQEHLVQKVADYWSTVAPIVSKSAELFEHLNIPGVSTGATLLETLAKAPITSLPPVEGLEWFVKKITGMVEGNIMEGVRWTLPRALFEVLGNRVTGSISVYFHPYSMQEHQKKVGDVLQTESILAQAVIHTHGKQIPHSGNEKRIGLQITPSLQPMC